MQMLSAVETGVFHFRVPHKTDIPATSSVVTVVVEGLAVQFVMVQVISLGRQGAEFLPGTKWQVVHSINNIHQLLSNTSKKFQEQTQTEILSWISMKYMHS